MSRIHCQLIGPEIATLQIPNFSIFISFCLRSTQAQFRITVIGDQPVAAIVRKTDRVSIACRCFTCRTFINGCSRCVRCFRRSGGIIYRNLNRRNSLCGCSHCIRQCVPVSKILGGYHKLFRKCTTVDAVRHGLQHFVTVLQGELQLIVVALVVCVRRVLNRVRRAPFIIQIQTFYGVIIYRTVITEQEHTLCRIHFFIACIQICHIQSFRATEVGTADRNQITGTAGRIN